MKVLNSGKTDIRDLSKIIGPLYGRMNIVDDNKHPIDKIYHRTVYSKSEMVQVLKNCGFTDIKDYEWQKFVHADYDDQSQSYFPHMQKENGIHIMQNLQDTK